MLRLPDMRLLLLLGMLHRAAPQNPAVDLLDLAEPGQIRILFLGNSMMSYPSHCRAPDAFENIAETVLGVDLHVRYILYGGCTLHALTANQNRYSQMAFEQEWDYVVVQEQSILPIVSEYARETYMYPALRNISGSAKQRNPNAKLVLWMQFPYLNGDSSPNGCPDILDLVTCSNDDPLPGMCDDKCTTPLAYPWGDKPSLTRPSCETSSAYADMTTGFDCMTYALVRSYLHAAAQVDGVDMVAPVALAWQLAAPWSNATRTPDMCKALTDSQYEHPLALDVPIAPPPSVETKVGSLFLYMTHPPRTCPSRVPPGAEWASEDVRDMCVDVHASCYGQHLAALTLFMVLFNRSPFETPRPLDCDSCQRVPANDARLAALEMAAFQAVSSCGELCGITPFPSPPPSPLRPPTELAAGTTAEDRAFSETEVLLIAVGTSLIVSSLAALIAAAAWFRRRRRRLTHKGTSRPRSPRPRSPRSSKEMPDPDEEPIIGGGPSSETRV